MPNANGEDAQTGPTSIHEDTNNDRGYDKTSVCPQSDFRSDGAN